MSAGAERRKAVVAASFGNVIEWFDFAVYGYFATVIAYNFFVGESELTALLATFAAFAVGFFMRPLGAVIIGNYGDKVGRRKALALTILMMAVSTILIGILPTYEQIGVLAPILLVIARLAQGFSAGGEWGGSSSFMVEHADETSKGFWGSWQQVSTAGGLFLGSLAGLILTSMLTEAFLYSWGWRIPFIFGGILGLFGLYLRSNVEESPEFEKDKEKGEVRDSPLKEIFTHHKKELLLGFGFTVFWTVSYYGLLTFMPSYLTQVIGLSSNWSFAANTICIFVLIVSIPFFGSLSDRIGRKPLLLTSTISGLVLTYPLYAMVASGSIGLAIIALIIFAIMIGLFSGPGVAAITEIFPSHIRYTGLSIGYNFAVAAFGGTAPFISTYLVSATGNSIAPAFYIIASALVTTIVLFGITFNQTLKGQVKNQDSKQIIS